MLSPEGKQDATTAAGFISYAQLGINQLGAVYEGLMAYTGFYAHDDLYEVAKGGDPSDGTWMRARSTRPTSTPTRCSSPTPTRSPEREERVLPPDGAASCSACPAATVSDPPATTRPRS